MSTSLVYQSAWGYELVMRALYGRHYAARYRAIATLIPAGSSVLELCCGPGFLFQRHLRANGVTFTGLDINPRFIARIERLGGQGEVCDLALDHPLPLADTVLMQASLYHFLPDAGPIVNRMRRAARLQVIVAEPVRNLATSGVPVLSRLAQRYTDAGTGAQPRRFTAASLEALFQKLGACPLYVTSIPGGREKIYVLDPSRDDVPGESIPPSGRSLVPAVR